MDVTLLGYRGLDVSGATRRACAVVNAARRHGTDAVTLYHNNHVARTQVRRHYDDMIDSLARPVGMPADGPGSLGSPAPGQVPRRAVSRT